MDKKLLFNDALASLVEFAAANANHVSKEDIHTFFNEIISDKGQYELIYKYLQESKIKVDGMDYIVSASVTKDLEEETEKEFAETKELQTKVVETEAELAFIEMYKKDLSGIPPVNEDELASLLEALGNGDTSVTNRIIESQLSLVAEIAGEFRGQGVTYGDLIQEGNVGLMLAISEFHGDASRFKDFIRDSIYSTLNSVINQQINAARVGEHLASRMNELDEISRELTELLGRAPSFEELAQKMGISTEEVETIVKTSLNVLNAGDSQDSEAISEASTNLNSSDTFINNTDKEFEPGETDMGDPLEWHINKNK